MNATEQRVVDAYKRYRTRNDAAMQEMLDAKREFVAVLGEATGSMSYRQIARLIGISSGRVSHLLASKK